MEKIMELVEMAHLLSAAMDETDSGVFSLDMYSHADRGPVFLTRPEFFLKHFKGFNIEINDMKERKFLLTKEVQGITFSTRVKDLTGLNELKWIRSGQLIRHKKSLQRTPMRVSH